MPRILVPSDEEWEEHKDHIIELYIRDNMSLARVIETMDIWFQFRASQKMYKRRFKQWNLHKYFTAQDIPEIERQRAGGNNPQHLLLPDGRVADASRVNSYLRRRARPLQQGPGSGRYTSMSCCLRAKEWITLSPLSACSQPEILFSSISNYMGMASPSFTWNQNRPDRLCMSRVAGLAGRKKMSVFHDRMMVAINNADPNDPTTLARSIDAIGECMDEMQSILTDQDPYLLANLMHIFFQIKNRRLPNDGPRQLEKVIVDFGKQLCGDLLGETHPLSTVWEMLDRSLMQSTPGLFCHALELFQDVFEAHVGPHHAGSLMMRLHLYTSQGNPGWKPVLIALLATLERGRTPSWEIAQFKAALANNFDKRRTIRATNLVCRLFRNRMFHDVAWDEGRVLPWDLTPEIETDLTMLVSNQ